jgi:hypothetical protein
VVDYGYVIPEGRLPVFSTCCEDRAKALIVLACETNLHGEYIARELALEQTLENLEAFSERLDQAHDRLPACTACGP